MMSYSFSTQTHGKWLLAGEHAVLRGSAIIVFPIPSKTLTLNYRQQDKPAQASFSGEFGKDAHLLFWSVLEYGLEAIGRHLPDLTGEFNIENTIPIGAGMGASAALCVALARWFVWKKWIKADDIFTFARRLEDLFHGESSGVDIAGAMHDHGLLFHRDNHFQPIPLQWAPCWYLSHSGQIGITAHCVKRVKHLQESDPELSARIDLDMEHSVEQALSALSLPMAQGLPRLATAINQARVCFTQWGLAGGKVEQHINQLLQAGALAAKPTGSGDGGFVLSLWEAPPVNTPCELLPV